MIDSLHSRHWFNRLLALVCALTYLSGCGNSFSSGRRGSGSNSGLFGDSDPTSATTTGGGSTATRNPGNTSGPNTQYDQALVVCDQYRNVATQIQNGCGGFFQQHLAEDFSDSCRTQFPNLYNNDCSGLKERLQSVFSACGTDISQGMNSFPASCQQVMRQYFR